MAEGVTDKRAAVRRGSWRLAVLLLAGLGPVGAAGAASWVAEPVTLPGPAREVRNDNGAVFVRADRWYRLSACAAGVCTTPAAPAPREVAADGIPHGYVAFAEGEGVRRAWYIAPTDRYDHGALGDRIEGGGLAVEDGFGRRYEVRLGPGEVFEDIVPRIADIDHDGRNEVVTIRSSLRAGAAIAVYGLAGGNLIERAATTPIGRTHRWLNVAGIADYTGNGRLNIALVKTPHIGGRLEVLDWNRGRLTPRGQADGFANHVIGSTELGLSATAFVNRDRIPDLILPDAERQSLRMVTAASGTVQQIAAVPLGGRAVTAIGVVDHGPPPVLVIGLDGGRLMAVRLKTE